LRILQVISSFPPAYAYGGPLQAAYGMSRELVRRGHKVTVFTTDVYNSHSRLKPTQNPVDMDGIRVYRFRNVSNRLAQKNLPLAPAMFTALGRQAKDFDLVHIHEYISSQALFVRHVCRKYGIPYLLQPHGSLPIIIEKQGWKKIYDRLWGLRLLRDAEKMLALNQMEAEQFKNLGIDEAVIEIIPNGINAPEFENLPPRGDFRRKHNLNSHEKIVLYLGRIHRIKGLDLLSRAFARLPQDFSPVKLVIAGPDNGYLATLIELIDKLGIKEKVLLTGALYGRDKLAAYVDAEAYVLPSSYETFPVTVLEALACCLSVITTRCCGITDMVARTGYVVERREDQLRDALEAALQDRKSRGKLREEGRRLVLESFSWEAVVAKLEDAYQRTKKRGQ
jgi:glycosyltransferase involved in cell wall biosynthesis